MTFGEKLREIRLSLNLSQLELAKKAGIGERSVYNYEQNDTFPRPNALEKIAKALNVSVSYLLFDDNASENTKADLELFYANAKKSYGNKGAREAREVISRAAALFAGGDLDERAKEVFYQSITQMFLESKAVASKKFSPRQRARKKKNEGS